MGPLFTTIFGLNSPVIAQVPLSILAIHGVYDHGNRFVRMAALLPYTIDQHVRDLGPLLRRMGPRTVVLGHSYGGLLAWELARANHDQLRGLVLVDPPIGMDRNAARREQEAAKNPPRWPDAQSALAAMMVGRSPQAQWSVALDVAVGLAQDDNGWFKPVWAPEAAHAVWDQVAQRLQPSPWRGPTLLIEAGPENGLYVSPWLVKNMRQQLGDRLEHVVLDAPHTIPADTPEQLAGLVSGFLESLR